MTDLNNEFNLFFFFFFFSFAHCNHQKSISNFYKSVRVVLQWHDVMENIKCSNGALNRCLFLKSKNLKYNARSYSRVSLDKGSLKIHKIVSEYKTTTEFFNLKCSHSELNSRKNPPIFNKLNAMK